MQQRAADLGPSRDETPPYFGDTLLNSLPGDVKGVKYCVPEISKFNRDLYTDNSAFRMMESDAARGRSFEDIVVEYDDSYADETPLKVFGGQHRVKAITESLDSKVNVPHGVRVYFQLSREQKADIARANNTAIAVANDLLDRMQEELLGPQLREWAQAVGLLAQRQAFADRRNSDGIPTVRIARTLIVNFHLGRKSGDDEFHQPVVCSSGTASDTAYMELHKSADWADKALRTMGMEFATLHSAQRSTVLSRDKDKYTEFANKTLHPCVAASWAYAAGLLQRDPKALGLHYRLPSTAEPPDDPLNAAALLKAHLTGVDNDSYRGLGARMGPGELGRMLTLFVLQAREATRPGITLKLANFAIKEYEWKRQKREADRARRGI